MPQFSFFLLGNQVIYTSTVDSGVHPSSSQVQGGGYPYVDRGATLLRTISSEIIERVLWGLELEGFQLIVVPLEMDKEVATVMVVADEVP